MLYLVSSLRTFRSGCLIHPFDGSTQALNRRLQCTKHFFQLLLNQLILLIPMSAFLFDLQYPVFRAVVLLFQVSATGCQVLNLFIELGDLVRGLLKLLDPVSQVAVVLLQMLAVGCQLLCLLVELRNLLRGSLSRLQALIEAAISELETPIPDQPIFLQSSHWSEAVNSM